MAGTKATDLSVGVSIPAYNNPSALRAALTPLTDGTIPGLRAVVVVDDSGNGELKTELSNEFSEVSWIVNARNLGFGASANRAVEANPCDIVVLLNDDAVLREMSCADLSSPFTDERLFAVTFLSVNREGRFREGAKRVVWRAGIARVLHNPEDQITTGDGERISDYAVGGHCAFRRRHFLALGGFDLEYKPFYWEDVDLGVRARRAGLHTVFDERFVVVHDGASAIRSAHHEQYIREIVWRNRLRFSSRHATGIQSAFFLFTVNYLKVVATCRSDKSLYRALQTWNLHAKNVGMYGSDNSPEP